MSAVLLSELLAPAAAEPQGCRIDTVADLPLLPHAGITAEAATLQSQKVALLIDTGAFISVVSQRATCYSFSVPAAAGMLASPRFRASAARPSPGRHGARPWFGNDFLSNHDVDVDLPRQRFGLYRTTGCDAADDRHRRYRRLRDDGRPEGALAAGVALDGTDTDQPRVAFGMDSALVETHHRQFGNLENGDERMNNLRFDAAAGISRMLVGQTSSGSTAS